MKMRTRSILVCPFLAAAASLMADEAEFGLQAHLAMPTGKFGDGNHLDRKSGTGVGIKIPVDFGLGQILKPKLDYLTWRRDDGSHHYQANTLMLLVDYNHYLAEEKAGLFFVAGLGVHSTRHEMTRTLVAVPVSARERSTGVAYNFGLGYSFNKHVALEVKYLGMDLGELKNAALAVDSGFMANSVVATLSCTF